MLHTTKMTMASSALTALLLVALPASAFGDTAKQGGTARLQVADQLSDYKRTAFKMLREADFLKTFTGNRGLSWQSHAYHLNTLKEHVNELGQTLAELEAQKSMASASQVMAIEHARLHLDPIAQNLTRAIELVNENRDNVRWTEYAEAVSDIYGHADDLHNKMDTILDYEASKMRLDKLELQPASPEEGS